MRASGIPVLDIGDQTASILEAEAHRAAKEDQCDVIVLGCAGMAGLAEKLSQSVKLPVIDGVTTAVAFCEALAKVRAA
ncbi:MAG: aspartate/glutamate racemase family protein [Pseudomonadota bacterium]